MNYFAGLWSVYTVIKGGLHDQTGAYIGAIYDV